ncbi:MAG TPA: TadE/TadG family type IV pilus assembly protein [Caulobacteraceae bacterium]|nr:TadE/TadG family type IV pilus assembly protein [Caulobacteraceae bacterium]
MTPRALASRWWSRLRRDNRGVAALEFALLVPVVIIVYAGGFEIAQAATVYRKLTDTTVQLANVTSQYTQVAKSDLSTISSASSQIMAPYSTSSLTIVVSEVGTDAAGAATVQWSQKYPSGSGLAVGAPVTMPTGFATPSSYYILVQTSYTYTPTIGSAFVSSIPMTNQIFMVPRQSSSIPCSDC